MDSYKEFFGNLGEWSELYVLGYLLSHGGAYAADANQSAIEKAFYEVLKIRVENANKEFDIYSVHPSEIKLLAGEAQDSEISRSEITDQLGSFFNDLVNNAHPTTFTFKSGNDLARLLRRKSLSASSAQTTSDLELVLKDPDTQITRPSVGFSVKSQLGSPSTLLNASGSTNFTYKVISRSATKPISDLQFKPGAVRKNIALLIEAGYTLEFHELRSEVFRSNLTLIDSLMVENMARLLLTFYSSKPSKFSEVSELAFPTSQSESKQKIFKLKQMLGSIAMGMRPGSSWDGDVTKFKGLIVVKAQGDVLIYYLFNLSDFQEFLYESVRFEVASTSRHKFGEIYEDAGQFFMKLNLQIRFTK